MKQAKVIVTGTCRGENCSLCIPHTALIGFLPNAQEEKILVNPGAPLPENMVDLDGKPIGSGKVPVSIGGSKFCLVSKNGGFVKLYAEITEKDGCLVFRGIRCEE
jgi:hypothetical protein